MAQAHGYDAIVLDVMLAGDRRLRRPAGGWRAATSGSRC